MNEKTIRRLRVWRDGTKAAKDDGFYVAPYELDLIDLIDALDKGDIDNWPRKDKGENA